MATKKEIERLIRTKSALAAKYRRLAGVAKSRPKQATLLHHAEDYRRQVQNLAKLR
jgi:hypothetical protein